MCPVIEKFVSDVTFIQSNDYGDFMRQTNLYLNELDQELKRLPYKDIHEKIAEMKNYTQYHPTWNLEPTLKKILSDAHYIDSLLHGHKQDWES